MVPGLAACAGVAVMAMAVSASAGGPALLYALLFGMAVRPVATGESLSPGIRFAARTILRIGVALLGVRIGVEEVAALGFVGAGTVAAGVVLTIVLGWALAPRFGFGRDVGLLTGGATAICGASAALAIAAVLPDRPEKEQSTLFTVVAVTSLSTVAMVVYPAIAGLIGLGDIDTGFFLGSTIHDVAQVVGAGYIISEPAGDIATVTKLFRVALLVPAVIAIGLIAAHTLAAPSAAGRSGPRPALIPWFLGVFVALAAVNSVGWIPATVQDFGTTASRWALIVAIAAIGLRTSLDSLRTVGWQALALVVIETLALCGFVLIVVALFF